MLIGQIKRGLALSAIPVLLGAAAVPAHAQPDYYPSSYAEIVEASKQEPTLLIQSNVGEANWRPVLDAFQEQYPWITVRTLDLGGTEVFERFYAEQAAGSSEADIILSASGAVWPEFIDKGNVVVYDSPESSKLPDWSKPFPGVYTISVDPYIIVYNKFVLSESEYPDSVEDLVALVKDNPGKFDKRIATIRPFGTSANQSQLTHYIDHVGLDKVVSQYEVLGPIADLQRSGGPVFEKILTGEYAAGWALSAIQAVPFLRDQTRANIIGFALPKDGLVMSPRYFAIAKTSKHLNSAKLFVDFLISKEGQEAVNAGGLIPYRSELQIPPGSYDLTYETIVKQIGEQNIIRVTLDKKLLTPPPEYVEKVNKAFGIMQ